MDEHGHEDEKGRSRQGEDADQVPRVFAAAAPARAKVVTALGTAKHVSNGPLLEAVVSAATTTGTASTAAAAEATTATTSASASASAAAGWPL